MTAVANVLPGFPGVGNTRVRPAERERRAGAWERAGRREPARGKASAVDAGAGSPSRGRAVHVNASTVGADLFDSPSASSSPETRGGAPQSPRAASSAGELDADNLRGVRAERTDVAGVLLLRTDNGRAFIVEDLSRTVTAGAGARGWYLCEIVERGPVRAWRTWCRHSDPVPRTSSRRRRPGARRGPPWMTAVGTFRTLGDAKRAALGGA